MKSRILFFIAVIISFSSLMACKSSKKSLGKHRGYLNGAYNMLRDSLKEAIVSRLKDTVKVVFPSNLLFGFDKSAITSESLPSMKRFANALNEYNKTAILISGHTDTVGSEDYNNKLSAQRADTAKRVLVDYNVKKERIETWGFGSRIPIAPNNTEEGRARNRRVEFIILYSEGKK